MSVRRAAPSSTCPHWALARQHPGHVVTRKHPAQPVASAAHTSRQWETPVLTNMPHFVPAAITKNEFMLTSGNHSKEKIKLPVFNFDLLKSPVALRDRCALQMGTCGGLAREWSARSALLDPPVREWQWPWEVRQVSTGSQSETRGVRRTQVQAAITCGPRVGSVSD